MESKSWPICTRIWLHGVMDEAVWSARCMENIKDADYGPTQAAARSHPPSLPPPPMFDLPQCS
ncbi:hypothetical protein P3342_006756 [Pyrenophora teres f. teres]|nr:hypothetical protein P3342_006756 [Pyrenophora teres f. teres]